MNLISTQRLFELTDYQFKQYHNLLKHLEPKIIGSEIKTLTDLTFGEVATIKINLREATIENILENFKIIFGFETKEILKLDVVKFYHGLNWIKKEIEIIYKNENENLSSTPDAKLKDAGIDDLNIFGELNTLIMLGKDYGKSPQEVENWNYNLVFSLMLHQKISNDIQKRFNELNKPQSND